jgi:hypothetical protein
MDKNILDARFLLLLPAALAFILLLAHCYIYRGMRLTLIFFGGVFLHTFMKELTHIYVRCGTNLLPPYEMVGRGLQILRLPLIVYIGWAMTFYLGWYLAEGILKRIGSFSDRVFPTIVWSALIAGAISYCVEATAINAGWWVWLSADARFKDFLVAPFSALEAWPAEASHFLLIFFLCECSRHRKQWWRLFLYSFVIWLAIFAIFIYFYTNFGRLTPLIRVYDTVRILLPVLFMFFYPVKLEFTRLDSVSPKKNRFFYGALPLFGLGLVLSICVITDAMILKKMGLLISTLPLIMFTMLSFKKIPLSVILALAVFSLISGNRKLYIACLPVIIFLMFMAYAKFYRQKAKYG